MPIGVKRQIPLTIFIINEDLSIRIGMEVQPLKVNDMA